MNYDDILSCGIYAVFIIKIHLVDYKATSWKSSQYKVDIQLWYSAHEKEVCTNERL